MNGVTIGEYTYGDPVINKWTDKYTLNIGRFCSFAEGVHIIVDGNHRMDWVSMYPLSRIILNDFTNQGHPEGRGNMVIGNDVWVGTNALIMPGVIIGDGAVVAGGSVVCRDVLPYEIVGGVPAKHIRFRFTKEQREALLKIAWWRWDVAKIIIQMKLLESGNIDEFIKQNNG